MIFVLFVTGRALAAMNCHTPPQTTVPYLNTEISSSLTMIRPN